MGIRRRFFRSDHPLEENTVSIRRNRRLLMEGCRRIVFCQSEKMILDGDVILEIHGKDLVLKELGNDVIGVEGVILAVVFREKNG
jgi:hypothetical protein